MEKPRSRGKRTVEETVQMLRMIIEEARMYMKEPLLKPEEKRCWTKTLADTMGVLSNLLAQQGGKQLEGEDLGSLLTRVTIKLRRVVMRRVRAWIRRSSQVACSTTRISAHPFLNS